MCTHTRQPPSSSTEADIASSKSRALAGSIVNVASERRSRRPASSISESAACRASRSTAGSNPRRRPRSTSSASITSRATSGRPSRRATTARPPPPPRPRGRLLAPEPPSPWATDPGGRTTTRSPTENRRSRLTTSRGPASKNGSATRNFPRRSSTATRAAGAASRTAALTGLRPRPCVRLPQAPDRPSRADWSSRAHRA